MSRDDLRLAMRLARQCGYVHYEPLFRDQPLTPSQWAEVIAYESLDPSGEWRADFRAAQQCLIAARAAGNTTAKLADFIPQFDRGIQRQTAEEKRAALQQWAATMDAQQRGR